MSITLPHTRRAAAVGARAQVARERTPVPQRRVRHEVRDGVAVIAFSATASSSLALLITLLVSWAR